MSVFTATEVSVASCPLRTDAARPEHDHSKREAADQWVHPLNEAADGAIKPITI
jgi:hypothetical protein